MADTALAVSDPSTEPNWLTEAQQITQLYTPPPIGRPGTSLTDVYRVHKLLKFVSEGNYISTALLAAGYSRQFLANWKESAKDGNVAAIALLDALEKAEAWAEQDAVSDVRKAGKAGPQFWAASATRLERRHPERWGKRADEGSVPRVVVQLGASAGEVKVGVMLQTASRELSPIASPPLSEDLHSVSVERVPQTDGSGSDK